MPGSGIPALAKTLCCTVSVPSFQPKPPLNAAHQQGEEDATVLSPSAPVTIVWILWQGAFWGLVLGTAMGAFRLLAEFFYGPSTCEGGRACPALICGLHYLYFGFFLFLVTLLTTLAVSLATKPISDVHVSVAVRMLWEEFQG